MLWTNTTRTEFCGTSRKVTSSDSLRNVVCNYIAPALPLFSTYHNVVHGALDEELLMVEKLDGVVLRARAEDRHRRMEVDVVDWLKST